MTNDEGNVVKTSPYSHTPLSRTSFKGGMWRVIYWVSPRTPEGGQAGKGDKTSLLHITSFRGGIYPAIAGYFGEGESSDRKVEKRRIARDEW